MKTFLLLLLFLGLSRIVEYYKVAYGKGFSRVCGDKETIAWMAYAIRNSILLTRMWSPLIEGVLHARTE